MDTLLEVLGISGLPPALKNRLVFSAFCLLIAVILGYFWFISREKIKAAKQDGKGLVYLAFSFVLFASIGLVTIYNKSPETTLLILASLISFCFLSSLSYFTANHTPLERLVHSSAWKNSLKYVAFTWVVVITLAPDHYVIRTIETGLAILAIATLGLFLTRYFAKRQLRFIAFITAGFFICYALLQLAESLGSAGEGKFQHVNTVYLAPAIALAVIVLAYTFNWINELNFYEISRIWTGEENDGEAVSEQAAKTSGPELPKSEGWIDLLAQDDLERVIKEMIIHKRLRNESLEDILNLASRNSRNNDNNRKDLISYDDYQRSRNKVSTTLMTLIRQ